MQTEVTRVYQRIGYEVMTYPVLQARKATYHIGVTAL